MKVKELIELLKTYDEDTTVYVWDETGYYGKKIIVNNQNYKFTEEKAILLDHLDF